MTLGLMQSDFLPYLGYYALIDVCDTWVPRRSGDVALDRAQREAPGDWARVIAGELGADRSVNGRRPRHLPPLAA